MSGFGEYKRIVQVNFDRIRNPAVLDLDSRIFSCHMRTTTPTAPGAGLDTSVSPMYNIPTKTHVK